MRGWRNASVRGWRGCDGGVRGRVSDREWRAMCESERETGIRLALFLKKPY